MNVIIGGTFGYLHRGHRTLITKAFEIGDHIYIGLTTDDYVNSMKPGEKVPSYSARKKALEGFVKGLGKTYDIKELSDRYGPSTTGNFDAIVVSEETMPVAVEINKMRVAKKLRPLSIVRVELVLGQDSRPISTSRITKGEIDSDGNRV